MKEINIIRENYPDIKFIFDFYDRFALKLQKVSLKEKTKDTLVFYDYYSTEIYYVLVRDVNRILSYCYNEYFFKVVLSGSSYYQKVKKVCEDLEVENYIIDLFFKSFFLAVKACSETDEQYYHDITPDKNRKIVLWMVLNAYSTAFDSFPQVDLNYYQKKATIILNKLEELELVSYNKKDITGDIRLKSYFPISCDTFRFAITNELEGFEKSIPMFDFLDLRQYLDNSEILDHNLLARMDRAIQTLIVISFNDAKFYNNPYSDNSYIKKLTLDKKLYELSKKKTNA